MSPAEPIGLADAFWLTAYDNVVDKPRIGGWQLGIGLGTALLLESVEGGYLELRGAELFRTVRPAPNDRALHPLLAKMDKEDEQAAETAKQLAAARHWPRLDQQAWYPEGPGAHRHSQHGHDLREWLSYLAYGNRAEEQVIQRLTRVGLVRRFEQRRLLGFFEPRVLYRPYDSNAAGAPSSAITTAVQRRKTPTDQQVLLAGLFFATGLHMHALATLQPTEFSLLKDTVSRKISGVPRELLRTADVIVSEAALR